MSFSLYMLSFGVISLYISFLYSQHCLPMLRDHMREGRPIACA